MRQEMLALRQSKNTSGSSTPPLPDASALAQAQRLVDRQPPRSKLGAQGKAAASKETPSARAEDGALPDADEDAEADLNEVEDEYTEKVFMRMLMKD